MITIDKKEVYGKEIIILNNVLSQEEINKILNVINQEKWSTADKYGKYNNDANIKSLRLSMINDDFAKIIENRVFPFVPYIKNFNNEIISDNKSLWTKDSINPYFRFIRYQKNHSLVAHYDDTHVFHSHKRTLMSVIIYLEDSDSETRFLIDNETNISDIQRNYNDKDSLGKDEDVILSIKSKAGQVVIFDHRLLHDATEPNNSQKTIIRTDITYKSPYLDFLNA